MVRKKTKKVTAGALVEGSWPEEKPVQKTMQDRLAMFSRTFTRPAPDGGKDDEYRLGVMFATKAIEARCEVLYEDHGLPVVSALRGTIGGAVTDSIMARIEHQFGKGK